MVKSNGSSEKHTQRRALALSLATTLAPRGATSRRMGQKGGHTHLHHHTKVPHATGRTYPPYVLTSEAVLGKGQVLEGAANQAERRWDRAVEVVAGELQVHQAGEVRADAVWNRS